MDTAPSSTIRVIDSHTAGEPTRLVMEGGPELGDGPLAEAESLLRLEPDDPFRWGIVPG